jgi:hypothetical protein
MYMSIFFRNFKTFRIPFSFFNRLPGSWTLKPRSRLSSHLISCPRWARPFARQQGTETVTFTQKSYSLRPILPFVNMDVSRHILVLNTSVFMKGNTDRREYNHFNVSPRMKTTRFSPNVIILNKWHKGYILYSIHVLCWSDTHHQDIQTSYTYFLEWNIIQTLLD